MNNRTLTIIGVIIGIVSLGASFDFGNKTGNPPLQISDENLQSLKELVNKIQFAKANANNANGEMDFRKYLETAIAKKDVDLISRLINSEPKKHLAVKTLVSQVSIIEKDYESTLKKISSLPRERMRVTGILLSHRRQIGVLLVVLKNITKEEPIVEYAKNLELFLYRTQL